MDTGSVFLVGLFNIAVAAVVAYLLFRWISPGPETAESFWRARKWAAWVVAMLTIALLTRVFNRGFDIDRFAAWLLGVVVWGGLAFAVGLIWTRTKEKKTPSASLPAASWDSRLQPASRTVAPSPPLVNPTVTKPTDDLRDGFDENRFWAAALQEFESPQRDPGTWARAFAESGGNEAAAKAEYLKARKARLQAEFIEQIRAKPANLSDSPQVASAPKSPRAEPVSLSMSEMLERLRTQGFTFSAGDASRKSVFAPDGTGYYAHGDQEYYDLLVRLLRAAPVNPAERPPVFLDSGPSIRERIMAMTVMAQNDLAPAIDLAGRAGVSIERVESDRGGFRFRVTSKRISEDVPEEFVSEAEVIQWVRGAICPRFLESSGGTAG